MRNKINLRNLAIAGFFACALASCSRDFLEVPKEGSITEESYYQDESQVFTGLVATYDALRKNSGGFENMITMMNAGSDDQYAGGGGESDGAGIQSFSNFSINQFTIPESFWSDHYQGIFRANILLQKISKVQMDASKKARFIAEAKTLRALYYFNLVRMFKNIPLILEPVSPTNMYSITQAKPADIYAQMEKDLLAAINDLPATVTTDEYGRLTKGAAQALLGKVYLYDGKKAEAATQLAAVNGTPGGTSQYGYKLLTNFSDLWVTNNKFNSESIIEVSHTNKSQAGWGNWGSGTDEGNSVCVMVGPRGYVKNNASAPDLPAGWSFNVWTQNFYDFMKTDPRFSETVFDLKALKAAGAADYVPGYKDTGYFMKKFLPTSADVSPLGGDSVLNYQKNSYIIRLADTYLLEAEALGGTGARAQALLDAVRFRAGLSSVPVSMQTIKDERRRELAGEGHRFFDLVRWGDAASVLASRGFKANKNEVFPIPNNELNGTKLVQNPGY
ncbi:RagB/SusD family nutrient uptake outer membrane protein [Cloacibacterium normanense]|uniref:RagB/SusD family nutrient uptake outer membrane protein n=1 Tax=Cloacibacterium normanense TaxID=237258 RepID=UPI00352F7EAC